VIPFRAHPLERRSSHRCGTPPRMGFGAMSANVAHEGLPREEAKVTIGWEAHLGRTRSGGGRRRMTSIDLGAVVGGLEEYGHAFAIQGGAGRVKRLTQEARKARRPAPYSRTESGGSRVSNSPSKAGIKASLAGVANMMADKFMRPAERRRVLEEEKERVKGLPAGAYTRHRLKVIESALELVKEIQQLEFDVHQSLVHEARRGQRRAKECMLDKDLQGLLSQLSL